MSVFSSPLTQAEKAHIMEEERIEKGWDRIDDCKE